MRKKEIRFVVLLCFSFLDMTPPFSFNKYEERLALASQLQQKADKGLHKSKFTMLAE